VRLFTYFNDKDEFGVYVRKGLCRRLLNQGKTFNENAEKHFISLLKAQCGNAFTRRMQGMFTDAEGDTVSKTRQKFVEWNKGSEKVSGVSLSVTVLNDCYWPIHGNEKFNLPGIQKEMADCISRFEEFYKNDTSGSKRLKWLYGNGTVALQSMLGKTRVELVVSPLQAAILTCFNSSEKLSFKDLISQLWPGESTGGQKLNLSKSSAAMFNVSNTNILKGAIEPLCLGKIKALSKEGSTDKEVGEEDMFAVKLVLAKRRKVVFPPGSARAVKDDGDREKDLLIKQRMFEVDAAMVRVMKSRNVCTWPDLQVQSVDLLKHRFIPPPKMLKARLESLIERQFIERDSSDRTKLTYVA